MSQIEAIKAKLSEYDFIIAIDTSGSMGEPVKPGSSISRWQSATSAPSTATAWAWCCSAATTCRSTTA